MVVSDPTFFLTDYYRATLECCTRYLTGLIRRVLLQKEVIERLG